MDTMSFQFRCTTCGELHVGMPTFAAEKPLSYFAVPEADRTSRCALGTDYCVIDGTDFFVRGCIELRVHGYPQPFVWGVWVSLSKQSYDQWERVFHESRRSHVGPFFGWLDAWLKPYPDTMNLKTRVHLRDDGVRPYIELEPTDHPLAVEQMNGISTDRVAEIYSQMVHHDA
jgi:hypothetical protein